MKLFKSFIGNTMPSHQLFRVPHKSKVTCALVGGFAAFSQLTGGSGLQLALNYIISDLTMDAIVQLRLSEPHSYFVLK